MPGITVAFEDLEAVTGMQLPETSRAALDRVVRGLLGGAYAGDVNTATGRAAEVLNAVYMSAAVRVMTNPTGARSIGLGSANVTFGGTDADVSNPFNLTPAERADLGRLARRAPTYLLFTEVPGLPYPRHVR